MVVVEVVVEVAKVGKIEKATRGYRRKLEARIGWVSWKDLEVGRVG